MVKSRSRHVTPCDANKTQHALQKEGLSVWKYHNTFQSNILFVSRQIIQKEKEKFGLNLNVDAMVEIAYEILRIHSPGIN